MLDVVIRGGRVVDGTGAPARQADVGIRDGRVVEIGKVTDDAAETVDEFRSQGADAHAFQADLADAAAIAALIQGTLPRPSELEVYLSDSGIYCRPIAGELQEQPVGAPAEEQTAPAPGTPLYMF